MYCANGNASNVLRRQLQSFEKMHTNGIVRAQHRKIIKKTVFKREKKKTFSYTVWTVILSLLQFFLCSITMKKKLVFDSLRIYFLHYYSAHGALEFHCLDVFGAFRMVSHGIETCLCIYTGICLYIYTYPYHCPYPYHYPYPYSTPTPTLPLRLHVPTLPLWLHVPLLNFSSCHIFSHPLVTVHTIVNITNHVYPIHH